MELRVVAIRDTAACDYHVFVTNIPADRLAADQIARSYAARWEIELPFRQLKTDYRLDELPCRRESSRAALCEGAASGRLSRRCSTRP